MIAAPATTPPSQGIALLADARALLAAIVESSDDAIISKDRDGTITSWNRSAERVFGYTAEEAIGKPVTMLIPDGMDGEEDRILARIHAGERVDHYETRRRTKDGRVIEVSLTVSPVRDAGGRIVGASKVARDVTEAKRAEAERYRARDREKELMRLSELLRFKTEFMNSAAHELGNPLTPMGMQLSLLAAEPALTPKQRKSVEMLQRSYERLSKLTQDLLGASRLQAGRLGVDKQRVDLAAVLREAAEPYDEAARRAGVTVERRIAGPMWLEADPQRLAQVVANLLDNALKFTPAGGRVTVRLTMGHGGPVVRVEDTGVGLAPEALRKLFQPFTQVHESLQQFRRGTGLGLYISRAIVELHGGTMWVESEGLGQGASFAFTVPAPPTP